MDQPRLNHWKLFLNLNSHIEQISDQIAEFDTYVPYSKENFDNIFTFDGTVPIVAARILDLIISSKENIIIPENVNKTGSTLFGWVTEGDDSDYTFDAAHKLISIFKLDINKFYFISPLKDVVKLYETYSKKYIIKDKIKNFIFSDILFTNKNDYDFPIETLKESTVEEKKLFICTNLTPRIHRFAAIGLINYYDLLDEGYVSSVCVSIGDVKYDQRIDFNSHLYGVKTVFSKEINLNDIVEKFQKIENKFPLRIDNRYNFDIESGIIWSHRNYKKDLYQACSDSLFQLVTENIYNNDGFFCSEKTFIPISLGKPFLILGSSNSLNGLRNLGFKTFHPYIDEAYDLEPNLSDRLKMVILELKRLDLLRKSDPKQFYSQYEKIKQIAEYNQNHFQNNI